MLVSDERGWASRRRHSTATVAAGRSHPGQKKALSGAVVQVHICLANTSGGNLVQGTWELYAKWSRHIAEYRPAGNARPDPKHFQCVPKTDQRFPARTEND